MTFIVPPHFGDFLLDVGVENLVDVPHPPLSQLFDDLVPPGEGRPGRKFPDGHLKSFRLGTGGHDTEFRSIRFMSPDELRPALSAKALCPRILSLALGAFHGPSFPSPVKFERRLFS
jgi:hypothetical protein